MSEDKRGFVRIGRSLDFRFTCDDQTMTGRLEDLGEGGAFVDTANPLDAGTEIGFTLPLPDGGDPIVGKALVQWRQSPVGMGIKFVGLSEDARERIKFYVAAEFFKSFSDQR